MLIITIFITLLIAMWAFILIYFRQRKEIDLLKKELKARKPKDDGLNPDVKALAKELRVTYERAEEIYKRARIKSWKALFSYPTPSGKMINMLFLNSPQKYFHKLRDCDII